MNGKSFIKHTLQDTGIYWHKLPGPQGKFYDTPKAVSYYYG